MSQHAPSTTHPQQHAPFKRFSDGGRPPLADDENPQWGDDIFVYPASLGNFAPADPARNVPINIDQAASFEWIETTCSGNMHGATAPFSDNVIIPITVQVTDSGSGRALFFAPIPINTICGTGRQPFLLPVTKVFVPLATVTITAQTYDGTNTWDNVWMVLIGRRVFPYGPTTPPWPTQA